MTAVRPPCRRGGTRLDAGKLQAATKGSKVMAAVRNADKIYPKSDA